MAERDEVPRGKFQDGARWRSGRNAVEFTLLLTASDTEERIPCRVSGEALDDAVGTSGAMTEERRLEQFAWLKDKIYAAVDRRLKAGLREPDGSILVQTGEIKPE